MLPPKQLKGLRTLSNSPLGAAEVCLISLTEPDSLICPLFFSVHPKDSWVVRRLGHRDLHDGVVLATLLQAEVSVSGGAGAPDHLAGAHHALLPHPEGGRPTLPGLIRRGVGRGAQDPRLHPPRLHGEQ